MNNETTEKKPLVLCNADEALSDLKQEFSNIFHSCNFNAFAEASELGFLNTNKSPNGSPRNPLDEREGLSESGPLSFKQKDTNLPGIPLKGTVSSPAIFFSSDNYHKPNYFSSAHSKQDFLQGTPGVYFNTGRSAFPSPFPTVKDFFQTQEYIDTYADEPLSLIWSNDIFKDIQQKIQISPDGSRIKKEENSMGYPKDYDQDDMYPVYMGFGNSNENSRSEKDFSRIFNLKREEQEATCETDISSQMERNTDIRSNPFSQSVVLKKKNSWDPLRKRSDSDQEDDERFDSGFDGKNRSSRGLRVLSLKVKDIVSEKKRTSYKEVAECLIDELGQVMKGKLQGESKDEQNVKRRVYDALNVLIAADILKKEGKAVYCDDKVANVGAHKRRKMKEDKKILEENIYDRKKTRKDKIESLKELTFKFLAIKNLINRNKNLSASPKTIKEKESDKFNNSSVNATSIGVIKDSPTFHSKNEEVIKFPFIVLVSSTQENSMNIGMNNGQKKLVIGSTSPFHIFGDIDVLLKLKLHHVPYEFFKENIPREIEKYLPKADFDALKHQ